MNDKLFEIIYQSICRGICSKFELMKDFSMSKDSYLTGKIDGMHEALFTVALYMDVAEETLSELRAMEGF